MADIYVISCEECGKRFSGVGNRRSEIRQRAKEQGWHVAIPERSWHVGRQAKLGRTVDICSDCMEKSMREAVQKIESHRKQRM